MAQRSACLDIQADVARRDRTAKRSRWSIDLDGDGTPDPMFDGFCSMMGGNCDTFVYASSSGCPRYLGQVQVTEVSSGPHCAEPPHDHVPCKLSAMRMMIHGELYEYFYAFDGTKYVEAGVGAKGPAPPGP